MIYIFQKTIFRKNSKPNLNWLSIILVYISLSIGFYSSAQVVKKQIIGQVYVMDGGDLSNIQIINYSDRKGVITDSQGKFLLYARLNDSLLLSSIQYKRKVVKISKAVFDSGFVHISLEEGTIELEEAVVKPYGLSGKLEHDLSIFEVEEVLSAATEELPNANVKLRKQRERNLYTARTWDYRVNSVKLDPLINAISGRTLVLKKRVAQDLKKEKYERVYNQIEDSVVVNNLKIPEDKIYEFYYFCEADAQFDSIVNMNVKADIWKFMVLKSEDFRKNLKLIETKE